MEKLFLVMLSFGCEAFQFFLAFSQNPFSYLNTDTSKGLSIWVEFGYKATNKIPFDAQKFAVSGDRWDLCPSANTSITGFKDL